MTTVHPIHQVLQTITSRITSLYDNEAIAAQNAWFLLEKLTGLSEEQLIVHHDIALSTEQQNQLNQWLDKLTKEHMPLQYILGTVPFLSVTIEVKPPILIPRPETEEWCALLIEKLQQHGPTNLTILDLCTGSGCIALALAKALPHSTIVATDISRDALQLAQTNANRNNITNVTFIKSDIYEQLQPDKKFDLIVSNPPYIAPEEWPNLQPEVRLWEDKTALVAEQHGLELIERIIKGAKNYYTTKRLSFAQLWIEIGYKQGKAVTDLMAQAGFSQITIIKDLYGKDRVVTGHRP